MRPARNSPEENTKQKASLRNGLIGLVAGAAVLVLLDMLNIYPLTINSVSNIVGVLLILVPFVYFGFLFTTGGFTAPEKNRIAAIIIFFLAAALFWSAFEQAGSTLNLFADRYTNNKVFGAEFPSTWWQSVNSIWIIALSPVFAWLWLKLNNAGKEPSTPMKFTLGLLFVGLGFLLLVPAAQMLNSGVEKVGVQWLLAVYFIHTVGELCLSPVGLSAMTKLAPERIVGQMMGIWFMGAALGNYIGGRVGGMFESFPLKNIFFAVFCTSLAASVIMFVLIRWMKRLMGEVK